MNTGDRFTKFLVRGLIVICCGFLVCLTVIGWRISQLISTVNQSLATVSQDVARVTRSAAQMAAKVDSAVATMEKLESQAKESVSMDELASVMDEMTEISAGQKGERKSLEGDAKTEIAFLLDSIRDSNYRFGHDEDIRSAGNYYLRFKTKVAAYKNVLSSAEDFIEKVATRTIGGNEYFVVLESGEKRPLDEWLTEKLKERRKSR